VVNGKEKRAWLSLDHTQKLSSGKMKNVFVKKHGGKSWRSGSEKENVKHVYCHSLYSRELLRKVMKHFYTRQLSFHRARTEPRPLQITPSALGKIFIASPYWYLHFFMPNGSPLLFYLIYKD